MLDVEPVPELEELSEIEVSAAMSSEIVSQPDLSRSLYRYFPFTAVESWAWDSPWLANDGELLANPANALNLAALDIPLHEGDLIRYWMTGVELVEPNSHPGAGVAREQVFEDIRAYLSFIDEHGKVFAVHQLTPLDTSSDPTRPLTQMPIIGDNGRRGYDFFLEFLWLADSQYDDLGVQTVLLIGAAGPSIERLGDMS